MQWKGEEEEGDTGIHTHVSARGGSDGRKWQRGRKLKNIEEFLSCALMHER